MELCLISDSGFWSFPLTKLLVDELRMHPEVDCIRIHHVTIDNPMCDLSGAKTRITSVLHLPNMARFRRQSLWEKATRNARIIARFLALGAKTTPTTLYLTSPRCLHYALCLKPWLFPKIKIVHHYYEMWDWDTPSRDSRFYRKITDRASLIDLVLVPERNRLHDLATRMPELQPKSVLLHNTTNRKSPLASHGRQGPYRILHVGNTGTDTYWKEILDAVGQSAGAYRLDFVGNVVAAVREYAQQNYPKDIIFHGEVPHSQLEPFYRDCDIGLIMYKGLSPNLENAAPNKLYEYWSYGVPVLAPNLTGLKSQVTETLQGVLVDFGHPHELRDGIAKISLNCRSSDQREQLLDLFNRKLSAENVLPTIARKIISC